MDPIQSRRAEREEEEVESHDVVSVDAGVPSEVPPTLGSRSVGLGRQAPQAFMQQMVQFFQQIAQAVPGKSAIGAGVPSEAPTLGYRSTGSDGQASLAFMQQMVQFFQQVAQAAPQKSAIEKMAEYKPVDFYGRKDDDPTVAEYWLERTERILDQMHCTLEEKKECAVFLLQEDAYQWWVTVTREISPQQQTWEFFLEEFKKRYVGRIYLDQMKRKFLNLRQCQMSVTEYEREFTYLSRYAGGIVTTEAERCRRFEDGLNYYLRLRVTGFLFEEYNRLVSAALNVERVKNEEQARRNRSQKRAAKQSSSAQSASKKSKGPQSSGQSTSQKQNQAPTARSPRPATSVTSTSRGPIRGPSPLECEHCGKRHRSECWKLIGACYNCGSTEHLVRDCPRQGATPTPQIERSTLTAQRGRKPGGGGVVMGSQGVGLESVNKQETRTPTRAYVIRGRNESDAADVIVDQEGEQGGKSVERGKEKM